jgi:hypothetical protein
LFFFAFGGETSGLNGPAARWGSAGFGLRGLRRLLKGESFRAAREGGVFNDDYSSFGAN